MEVDINFITIKQGAEAKLYMGDYLGKSVIVKERFNKRYRHPDLDDQLFKERMKAEARAIIRSKVAGVRTPAIFLVDFDRRCIFMEEIEDSETVKDYINRTLEGSDNESQQKLARLATEIGICIGKIHKNSIVHGDLTTSNMLVTTDSNDCMDQLYLIDFGLSHTESKVEDKGVDLYVLERAMQSTHPNADELFPIVLDAYRATYKKGASEVLNKLDEVRARGRKRTMVG